MLRPSTLLPALLVVCVLYPAPARSLPPAPLETTPGVYTRCDRTVSCIPYQARDQHSLDFLCCEDANGWTAAHVIAPMGVGIWFGNPVLAVAVAFWFEGFEAFMLTVFRSYIIFTTSDIDLETLAGSIIGDALIQGSIGAILSYLLLMAFDIPGPMRSWYLMSGWMRFKYVVLLLLYWFAFGALNIVRPDINTGIFIVIGIHGVLLLLVFPLATKSNLDNAGVWQRRKISYRTMAVGDGISRVMKDITATSIPELERWRLFVAWFAVNLLICLQTTGISSLNWAANDWYQVWVAALLIALVLTVIYALRVKETRTPRKYKY